MSVSPKPANHAYCENKFPVLHVLFPFRHVQLGNHRVKSRVPGHTATRSLLNKTVIKSLFYFFKADLMHISRGLYKWHNYYVVPNSCAVRNNSVGWKIHPN